MPKNLSFSDATRLLQIYREVLGRELTPGEQKYLGLSVTAMPLSGQELPDEAREKWRSKRAKAS